MRKYYFRVSSINKTALVSVDANSHNEGIFNALHLVSGVKKDQGSGKWVKYRDNKYRFCIATQRGIYSHIISQSDMYQVESA